jgi:hypothetical protein
MELPALGQVGRVAGQLQLGPQPVNQGEGHGPAADSAASRLLDLLLEHEGTQGAGRLRLGPVLQAVLAEVELTGAGEHRTWSPAQEPLESLLEGEFLADHQGN